MASASREYEETANSLSHGVGFVAALMASPYLLQAHPRSVAGGFGTAIFLVAMAALYLTSTLYHALPDGRCKQAFLKLDCCVIFLFIAATYTAFAAGALLDTWNRLLLVLVWCAALIGLALTLLDRLSRPLYRVSCYLAFGWLTLIAAIALAAQLPRSCCYWLLLGGMLYSIGVVFYLVGARVRFSHLGWHLLVMLGNACHCVALAYR
jgi:hemolysin III